jgi:hypothetical protein
LQRVMLAFTETCLDNNKTDSGSLVLKNEVVM